MKQIALAFALAISSLSLASSMPSGWKVITDAKKLCQYAVPPNWIQDKIVAGMSDSPDRKINVTVHGTDRGQTLAYVKSMIKTMLPPEKMIEDSDKRYWYAYKNPGAPADTPETNWYVAVPGNGNVCAAQLTFKESGGEALARQIVDTIGPSN